MTKGKLGLGGTAAAAVLAAVGGWLAAQASSGGGEPRFPQLTLEQLIPAQRPVGEKILSVSSVGLAGPYNSMIRTGCRRAAGAAVQSLRWPPAEGFGRRAHPGPDARAAVRRRIDLRLINDIL